MILDVVYNFKKQLVNLIEDVTHVDAFMEMDPVEESKNNVFVVRSQKRDINENDLCFNDIKTKNFEILYFDNIENNIEKSSKIINIVRNIILSDELIFENVIHIKEVEFDILGINPKTTNLVYKLTIEVMFNVKT